MKNPPFDSLVWGSLRLAPMTEVEVQIICTSTSAGCPQAVQIRLRQWLSGSLQVRAITINGTYNVRNAAYDFSVKLSSCICRHTDIAVLAVGYYVIPRYGASGKHRSAETEVRKRKYGNRSTEVRRKAAYEQH